MKKSTIKTVIYLFIPIILSSQLCFGINHNDDPVDPLDPNPVQTFRESLLSKYSEMEETRKNFLIQFQTDTFSIELAYREALLSCNDQSTEVKCLEKKAEEYNGLVTKYYMLLNQQMDEVKRPTLKQSQKEWLKYKNSERDFLIAVHGDVDNLDETALKQEALIYLNITQSRLFLLKEYLIAMH